MTALAAIGGVRRCSLSATGTKAPSMTSDARVEFGAEGCGVRGHVAPVAEFGAGIAGFGELIEHAPGADLLAAGSFEFESAPGTWGVSDQESGHE